MSRKPPSAARKTADNMGYDRIAVVGAGAGGPGLAKALTRAGGGVTLIGRDTTAVAAIAGSRQNPRLPGARLDERITVTAEMAQAAGADAVLLVVPAQALRAAATALAPALKAGTPVIACAKGIERVTHKFMTEVIAEAAPGALPAILSGPSFAVDVARGLPTAVTLAARPPKTAEALARAIGTASVRPIHSSVDSAVMYSGSAHTVL